MYRYLALAVLVLPTFVHADAESQLSRPFELRPAWNKALGPGYSGIAATARVVRTLYSDGVSDWVGVYNATSGEEQWTSGWEKHIRGDGKIYGLAIFGGGTRAASGHKIHAVNV